MEDVRDESARLSLLIESHNHARESFEAMRNAEAAKQNGKLKEATKFYEVGVKAQERVLKITEDLNRSTDRPMDLKAIVGTLVNILFMYADILDSCKRRKDGERRRKKAVELSKKFLGASGSAEAERSRAAALIAQARFNEALVALYNAREHLLSEGNVLKCARTSVDMTDILQWLGDFKRARDALDHAEGIYGDAELRGGFDVFVDMMEKQRIETEIPYYRGLIAKYTGDLDKAEVKFRQVLPKYQGLGYGQAIEFQLASVAAERGEYEDALNIASAIEPAMRGGGLLRPKLAALLNVQAKALMALDDTETAIEKLEEGLGDLEEYYDLDLRWRLEWQYALALRQSGSIDESIQAYGEAIDTVVNLRKSPLGYRLDSTYLLDKLDLFREAVALAADEGMAQSCAVFMDAIKSRTLSATLSTTSTEERTRGKPEDTRFEDVTRELDRIEYKGFVGGWTRELRGEREQLLARRASLLEELRFADPRWRNMTVPVSLDVMALMDALKSRNQAALSLFKSGNQVSAVVLTGDAQKAGALTISDRTASNLAKYVANLQESETNPRMFDPSSRLSINLESLVPEELISLAVECDSVVVVPHGELHLLPWAGLNYRDKRFFEFCAVGVLPNLSCLLSLHDEPATSPCVALVGDPNYTGMTALDALPYSAREISQINEIYRSRGGVVGDPLTGADASEVNFWNLARNPAGERGILHVSCHGGMEADEPMNSGLYMSDGKIDAAEVARTPLVYSEVVLSACSTGWRPMKVADVDLVADDVLGLPGAFLEAGARSVLLSIPKAIDDISSVFMIQYHENRSTGSPPLVAFREAQIAMMANDDVEPAMWIGFTLYGCC